MADEKAAPENRARQGVKGHNVRYVLAASLALAAIAWIAVEYFVR